MAKVIGIGLLVLLIISGIFYFGSSEVVQGGHAAVVTHHGRYVKTVGPGRTFEPSWSTKYNVYDTRWQNAEYVNHDPGDSDSKADYIDWAVETNSSDGTTVRLTAVFRYQTPIDSLQTLYDKTARDDSQVWNKIVNLEARQVMRDISTTTPIRALYLDDRASVSDQMEAELSQRLARFGIVLDSFSIKEVIPPDEYVANIQLQQNEYEAAKLAEAETETARQKAEKQAVQAQGEADAQVILAQGQADANAILAESLTPEIVLLEYYEALQSTNWAILDAGSVQPTLPIQEPQATPEG